MRVRLRRLKTEYDYLSDVFKSHPKIKLIETTGTPPEKYIFEISAKGLCRKQTGEITKIDRHQVEILLPASYPMSAPFCRMLNPVFHPNISYEKICIADHWSADQTIYQLIIRIAEMISFQVFNVKSPLNAEAAFWCEKNKHLLPLDRAQFS